MLLKNKLKQHKKHKKKGLNMADIKHVGRVRGSGRKCLVVFRTLPNDAFNCLVVLTEHLHPTYHDALINLVESNAGQTSFEFADVLARSVFSDGTQMLQSLHLQGMLTKLPTDQIEMVPNSSTSIVLSELNQLIAESRGCSVQDLAIQDTKKAEVTEIAQVKDITPKQEIVEDAVTVNTEQPLSDEDLAKKYRSDADRLAKEAAALRRMAEELVPAKKKSSKSSEASTA
jgi:hypothetical protein